MPRTADDDVMALHVGQQVGHYEVIASLGAGGMGEVYQARDTTLDREVAIKILPPAFTTDADRLARLEREAKLLAALNHPNIAAVYALERIGDRLVLVMELVPGPTLAERLPKGRAQPNAGLEIAEALGFAVQIAHALEAAHAKGIIHRDLKPANIKVTPDGKVKLLDFGLAKAFADDAAAVADLSHSPTMLGATSPGVILGTASYMSPEQARGRPADNRTDVWSFGCVLYEMLTGTQAFPGDTITDTLAAIVRGEPNWQALPPDTPHPIRSLLRRCLQKDPDRRLHHVADARLQIEEAMADSQIELPRGSVQARGAWWTRAIPWAVAALALGAAAIAIGFRPDRGATGNRPVARLDLNLPAGVEMFTAAGRNVAVSLDGTRVAFVGVDGGSRQVWVRALDQFEAVPLRGTDNATACFFSPDGKSIGFVTSAGSLRRVSLSDGLVVTIAEDVSFLYGAAWGLDDRIVFPRAGALWQVPAVGGMPKQLTTIDRGKQELFHAWPAILPGGDAILFASASGAGDASQIELMELATGERRVLVERGTLPLYAPSGHLIFYRDGELLAAPFDALSRQVKGSPIRLVDNLSEGNAGVPVMDLSMTGSLVYSPTTATSTLVWVSREGAEQPVNDTLRSYANPRLAPDARRVIVQVADLWLQDLARATFTKLTSRGVVSNGFPIWTPDGRAVLFRTATGLRLVDVDGGGRATTIPGTTEADYPGSISADGDTLLFLRSSADTSFDIYSLSIRDPSTVRTVLKTAAYEGGARLAPDGHWLTYISNESGQWEVYAQPFPAVDRKWQISTQGGTQAIWNRNGREIFYRNGNKMMAVQVSATGGTLTLSEPRLLFDQQYAFGAGITIPNYDVSADGQRFLMVKGESTSGRLNVVLNWFDELARRVPSP